MKLSLTFQHGHARVTITAEDDWERRLMGVFASGESMKAEALVECKSSAHYSHGKVDSATITLARVNHE